MRFISTNRDRRLRHRFRHRCLFHSPWLLLQFSSNLIHLICLYSYLYFFQSNITVSFSLLYSMPPLQIISSYLFPVLLWLNMEILHVLDYSILILHNQIVWVYCSMYPVCLCVHEMMYVLRSRDWHWNAERMFGLA